MLKSGEISFGHFLTEMQIYSTCNIYLSLISQVYSKINPEHYKIPWKNTWSNEKKSWEIAFTAENLDLFLEECRKFSLIRMHNVLNHCDDISESLDLEDAIHLGFEKEIGVTILLRKCYKDKISKQDLCNQANDLFISEAKKVLEKIWKIPKRDIGYEIRHHLLEIANKNN